MCAILIGKRQIVMAGDMTWVPSILDFRQTEVKETKSKKVDVEDKGLGGYR